LAADPTKPAAGYSGTPLVKKLGIKPGAVMHAINAPPHYANLLHDLPAGVKTLKRLRPGTDFVHLFATKEAQLAAALPTAKAALKTDGMLWVSWPKKAAKQDTDLTEDRVRALALKIGLVDVKVCAVDDTWSGLKLVYRLKDR
jgi:hypothetical protein